MTPPRGTRVITGEDLEDVENKTDELDKDVRVIGDRLTRVELQQQAHEQNDVLRHGQVMDELKGMKDQMWKLVMILIAALLSGLGVSEGVKAMVLPQAQAAPDVTP